MKKALIVIDMQNDFIDGTLGSPAAQAIVPRVAEKIRENIFSGSHIILTKDTHTEDYLKTQEGKNLPIVHCVKGTPGWEIAREITLAMRNEDYDNNKIFTKPTFGSLELAQYLKDTGPYKEIELIGLVSSICVISNALIIKAHLPEIIMTVDAACTAGVTEEDHQASLCVMKMCHIHVINETEQHNG